MHLEKNLLRAYKMLFLFLKQSSGLGIVQTEFGFLTYRIPTWVVSQKKAAGNYSKLANLYSKKSMISINIYPYYFKFVLT